MMKNNKTFLLTTAVVAMLGLSQGCKQSPGTETGGESDSRGVPTIVCDTPVFDEKSQTFSLTIHADSTARAEVTYFLLDGDSILMQCNNGYFSDTAPLEEGYNVQARAVWTDTTIITPKTHVVGFIIPREPIEKLAAAELQRLINAKNAETIKNYRSQSIKLSTVGGKRKPELLNDVFTFLGMGVWESVTVTDVTYDENNFITSITLKPTEQQDLTTAEGDEDADMFYDEY